MEQNVGSMDRILRVMIGLFLISMLFWVEGSNKYFGLIGIVPLLTASMKSCPLYLAFKLNTLKKKIQEK